MGKRPLQDMIQRYADSKRARFHMPGHKGRAGTFQSAWDITEVAGTDNLYEPTGAIAEAQKLCADAFGATESIFLTGGSTVGVLAMVLATCKPGDKMILGRDCHKSMVAALILLGLEPVFIAPRYDMENALTGYVDEEDVINAIDGNPDAKAVFLTRPNYYGLCMQLQSIIVKAHKSGIKVLVDEAHGAHFPFHPAFPDSAGKLGADLWVQSAHKTLNALGQGAYLHCANTETAREALTALSLVQTSSPSYPIMASLDRARDDMVSDGRALLQHALDRVQEAVGRIERIEGLEIFRGDNIQASGGKDPLRLVIDVSGRGLSGYTAAGILSGAGVEVEMADRRRLVLICTPWDRKKDYNMLCRALAGLPMHKDEVKPFAGPCALPEKTMNPREAYSSDTEWMPLKECAGRTAAGTVGTYPPGTPAFIPGEVMDKENLNRLLEEMEAGAGAFGLSDGKMRVVK